MTVIVCFYIKLVNNHLAIKVDDIINLDKVIEKLPFSPEEMKSLYDRMRIFQLKHRLNSLPPSRYE
ncbi:hypothetical protein C0971_02355 [Bacillus methanolicus]|nr:hypothetical protein C0971_02355 [Bacillus methanolicus]